MWIAFVVVLIGAALVVWVGWRGWQEKLPRQHWAGIRTPYAMANDEQWAAVNKYGAPYLIFGGVAAFAGALAMLPFALAGALPDTFAASVLIAFALILSTAALMGWLLGTKAAKASLASPRPVVSDTTGP